MEVFAGFLGPEHLPHPHRVRKLELSLEPDEQPADAGQRVAEEGSHEPLDGHNGRRRGDHLAAVCGLEIPVPEALSRREPSLNLL